MSNQVNQELLQAKCDYFVDVQLWPLKQHLRPDDWLSNFLPNELTHAIHLLNSFIYISESLVNEMFAASFQTLSRLFRAQNDTLLTSQARWRDFFDTVRFTYVTGETPNPTDSGFTFARKARQLLGIPEERIQTPEATAKELVDTGPWPVVFVDDFVGSGSQFITTWDRHVSMAGGRDVSFNRLSRVRGQSFYYCPLFCCSRGLEAIRKFAPQVHVNSCHILPDSYSALRADSVIWPTNLLPTAATFVKSASARAGVPDTDGAEVDDWQGFQKLGLALAFQHSVPDATLPIFYWEKNGWKPLIRRA